MASSEPLRDIDEWDEDVRRRYGVSDDRSFREYDNNPRAGVSEFYQQNHVGQTVAFNRRIRKKYLPLRTRRMSVWRAMEYLNQLVDESDPDTELPQIAHAMQTAEAIRNDGHPDWFVVTGLIHDMGKVLCLFGEPQWAVVGDTFPIGCRWSEKIVYPELFAGNPDSNVPEYQTKLGIYSANCGLDQVVMSWGHDEYLYHVVHDYLPAEALAIIRYHSFYAAHRENDYEWLMSDSDHEALRWVRRFNQYDLYTKMHNPPDVEQLTPYYRSLVESFIPGEIWW